MQAIEITKYEAPEGLQLQKVENARALKNFIEYAYARSLISLHA
jgi:hypothetical protein